MQRWHLTAGLTVAAVLAAVLAPQLHALTAPEPAPAPPPTPEPPPPPAPEVAPLAPGVIQVDARLDQPTILAEGIHERSLILTLSADEMGGSEALVRRPLHLSVALDGSGSMTAGGKMRAAKNSAKQLADAMGPEDTYSLVVFNDAARTIVPAQRVTDPKAIHRKIDGIFEGGGTDLMSGIARAADQLPKAGSLGGVSRLVVLSDGNANVGLTDPNQMGRRVADLASAGITVSTVGLGLDYNEDLLARLADLGGGSYTFVDHASKLDAAFAEAFHQSSTVVARETTVQLQLPPQVELIEVFGWEIRPNADGWSVWMGDFYAGEQRKIVARVRVHTEAPGILDAASVRATYHDLNEGEMRHSDATASATLTLDPVAVAASVDVEASEAATRAWASWHMDQSTRAYAEGNKEESKRLIAEGRDMLERAARQLQVPSLAAEAEDLRQLGTIYDSYDPSSREGQRAIKGGKEMFRGRAR